MSDVEGSTLALNPSCWNRVCGYCGKIKPETHLLWLEDGCVVCKICFAVYFKKAVQRHIVDNAPPVCPCEQYSKHKIHTNLTVNDALHYDKLNGDSLGATLALKLTSMLEISELLRSSATASAWRCSRCNKLSVRKVSDGVVLTCQDCQYQTCGACRARIVSVDHAVVHERVCGLQIKNVRFENSIL